MQQLNNFSEANRYLGQFYKNTRTKYTLDNMRQLMAYLGNPQDTFKTIHVAGTSGKTSTAYYMSALLAASGYKTGLTVSPHVGEINERVQINGQPLPEKVFCRALTEFLALIEDCPVKPSWFEAMIAFAYWYFAREKVDYAAIEVGLGGLKDGTNVINRADKVCLLTDIGHDHSNVLGKSLAEIAAQKVGIVQPGNQVFTYDQEPEITGVFKDYVSRRKASLEIVDEPSERKQFAKGAERMPEYQLRNWLLAYHAYRFLEDRDDLPRLTSEVLRQTQAMLVPGRMEIRKVGDKTVIMDGAHNVQKITALIKSFRRQYPDQKPVVLLALRAGKEYKEIASLLNRLTDHVIVTTFETNQDVPVRSMDAQSLADAFRQASTKNVEAITDHDTALEALLKAPEPVGLITGSFYLLGQIRNNEHLV
jgi:dihydrofolate synthase / folylpolyglutamate synthase